MARSKKVVPKRSKSKSAAYGLSPAQSAIERIRQATEKAQRSHEQSLAAREHARERLARSGQLRQDPPRTFS